MSQINLSDRVLARIVKSVAEAARANPNASQSALLNIATCEVTGPGHDWGFIKHAVLPVAARDLPAAGQAHSGKAVPQDPSLSEDEAAGFLYEATFRYVSASGDLGDLDLEDLAEECDRGDAIAGPLKITRTLTREARNRLADEFGSDASFFGERDFRTHRIAVEVACLVDFDDLDEDDIDEDGNCTVDGSYLVTVAAPEGTPRDHVIEVAKDLFHNSVAIACLDDFSILFRPQLQNEPDGDFNYLGHIEATEERLMEIAAEDDEPVL